MTIKMSKPFLDVSKWVQMVFWNKDFILMGKIATFGIVLFWSELPQGFEIYEHRAFGIKIALFFSEFR